MKYKNIVRATFVERPNRFIANCIVDGKNEIVHVKNTGRCKELLIKGVTVYLEKSDNPKRKTNFSLIAVQKGNILINIDSQAPNKIAYDAILEGKINLPNMGKITYIKREVTFENSRFDIYVESEDKKGFVEVKGVTLEDNGVVMFPDAPTQRGIKHLHELIKATKKGYNSYILFIVQLSGVKYFTPNVKTHKEFSDVLGEAQENGVSILVYDCNVFCDEINANLKVEYKI